MLFLLRCCNKLVFFFGLFRAGKKERGCNKLVYLGLMYANINVNYPMEL